MKQVIRLTENDLHRIVKESVRKVLKENQYGEGTPKQNAFLQKLMGDRWDDKYADLSVPETSKMIDQELAKNNTPQKEYEVVESFGSDEKIHPCKSFYEAKKKLSDIIDEYFDSGWSSVGDVRLAKKSDICWVALIGRRYASIGGSIYIRKKK